MLFAYVSTGISFVLKLLMRVLVMATKLTVTFQSTRDFGNCFMKFCLNILIWCLNCFTWLYIYVLPIVLCMLLI